MPTLDPSFSPGPYQVWLVDAAGYYADKVDFALVMVFVGLSLLIVMGTITAVVSAYR